ncbi:hypothetical protein AB1K62_05210 [Parasphingorhabdus sp. JC815]|uniref:hypothetical protein n=1 Tax=Parasphingorhabdus sp. JC815 TaxID=3232140 RepID=UPI003459FE08
MRTLMLTGLAGALAITPVTAAAPESSTATASPAGPDRYRADYDDSILMNEDRVFASHPGIRGSSTYQGDWIGAYREDGSYQGQWQGTYRDAQGTVYEGQYTGTFIGTNAAQTGVSYADDTYLDSSAEEAGSNYEHHQYSRAPNAEYRVPARPSEYHKYPQYHYGPQYQPQTRHPNGWNGGYYYPAYYQYPVTTIVIETAPTSTTTTYYEE